ncbi:MAG: EpsI family protein [Acidobacteria bacterium]|nr:EpsI family protein [Acidobacteriota bacterium]MBI3427735.1 EpsI family protein [Acidobacteriota bacterium]
MKPNLSYLGMLLFLLCAAAFTHYLINARASEAVPPHAALATFPEQLGVWKQVEAQTLTPGSIRELGADDFTSRTYVNERGATVFLFIAYYATQRARSTYHSPQNCLPGAGWTLGDHQLHPLGTPPQFINEYLIEKDGAQMLALYWYHGRGRVVASEYWGRLYTLADAVTRGRTDGALIRVIVPLSAQQMQEQAREAGLAFAQSLLPLLPGFVPD